MNTQTPQPRSPRCSPHSTATVWDDVIYPRLTPDERHAITTDMVRRGTFVHHHIPYGRAYYSGTWTTLLIADDLDPADQPAFEPAVDTALHKGSRVVHRPPLWAAEPAPAYAS